MTRAEIQRDWEWLFEHVSGTLRSFDSEEDITEFVTCKIESVIATRTEQGDIDGKYIIKYCSAIFVAFNHVLVKNVTYFSTFYKELFVEMCFMHNKH